MVANRITPQFYQIPDLIYTDGRYPWILTTRLVYFSPLLQSLGIPQINPGTLIITPGYRTDLASVPRVPFIYSAVGGKAVVPSIVHDHLYDCYTSIISRKNADRVFLEAMNATADPAAPWQRQIMYLGVRLGGKAGWITDTTHKCLGRIEK